MRQRGIARDASRGGQSGELHFADNRLPQLLRGRPVLAAHLPQRVPHRERELVIVRGRRKRGEEWHVQQQHVDIRGRRRHAVRRDRNLVRVVMRPRGQLLQRFRKVVRRNMWHRHRTEHRERGHAGRSLVDHRARVATCSRDILLAIVPGDQEQRRHTVLCADDGEARAAVTASAHERRLDEARVRPAFERILGINRVKRPAECTIHVVEIVVRVHP